MNTDKLISELKKHANFFEVYHKTSFRCFRKAENGNDQEVNVDILDAGPDAGQLRYHCVAKSEDGKMATGNPAESIEIVLFGLHWYDLDK